VVQQGRPCWSCLLFENMQFERTMAPTRVGFSPRDSSILGLHWR
jgi:hypothetical protein